MLSYTDSWQQFELCQLLHASLLKARSHVLRRCKGWDYQDCGTPLIVLTHSQAVRRNSQMATSPSSKPTARMLPCRTPAEFGREENTP